MQLLGYGVPSPRVFQELDLHRDSQVSNNLQVPEIRIMKKISRRFFDTSYQRLSARLPMAKAVWRICWQIVPSSEP
jgi:hypothetical protein